MIAVRSKSDNLIPSKPASLSCDDGMHCACPQRERTETHLIRRHTKIRNGKARNERANMGGEAEPRKYRKRKVGGE